LNANSIGTSECCASNIDAQLNLCGGYLAFTNPSTVSQTYVDSSTVQMTAGTGTSTTIKAGDFILSEAHKALELIPSSLTMNNLAYDNTFLYATASVLSYYNALDYSAKLNATALKLSASDGGNTYVGATVLSITKAGGAYSELTSDAITIDSSIPNAYSQLTYYDINFSDYSGEYSSMSSRIMYVKASDTDYAYLTPKEIFTGGYYPEQGLLKSGLYPGSLNMYSDVSRSVLSTIDLTLVNYNTQAHLYTTGLYLGTPDTTSSKSYSYATLNQPEPNFTIMGAQNEYIALDSSGAFLEISNSSDGYCKFSSYGLYMGDYNASKTAYLSTQLTCDGQLTVNEGGIINFAGVPSGKTAQFRQIGFCDGTSTVFFYVLCFPAA
jgi:hypothetical protein